MCAIALRDRGHCSHSQVHRALDNRVAQLVHCTAAANPKRQTLNPKTPNPKAQTLKPQTLNPKP